MITPLPTPPRSFPLPQQPKFTFFLTFSYLFLSNKHTIINNNNIKEKNQNKAMHTNKWYKKEEPRNVHKKHIQILIHMHLHTKKIIKTPTENLMYYIDLVGRE
jgi:UDP-2,3-diacylglucosamine pyrophosphatase LpxH